MPPTARPITEAVRSALAAVVTVGLAKAPTTALPYTILWPGGLSMLDGTVASPNRDAHPTFQLTHVSIGPEGAEAQADKARPVALGAITIAGYRQSESSEMEMSRPVQRDNDVEPPLFYVVEQFRIHLTPA